VEKRHFNILHRLLRLIKTSGPLYDWPARILAGLDWVLLHFSIMEHFSATVVLLCRKPEAKS
jgi:hypothetical protein